MQKAAPPRDRAVYREGRGPAMYRRGGGATFGLRPWAIMGETSWKINKNYNLFKIWIERTNGFFKNKLREPKALPTQPAGKCLGGLRSRPQPFGK